MQCKQATQLLSLRQERPLNRREKFSLRIHLMLCKGCRNFATQMDSLRAISRGYAKGEPPSSDDSEST
ncbi:zf-HC2 domain-containing protein [Microbulbifer sp. YPW1]|uniref:zf-HC2 domain-containing protein n=1 Tax=Microbulbifer sp. YPW1 TaxID=2745199 RepID=UPI002103ACEB|nr:zf-HC2 domain-containing protein [Microbulbifer sp. YPW1]